MVVWWKAVLLTVLFLAVTLVVGVLGGLGLALFGGLDDPDARAAQDAAGMPWIMAAGTLLGAIAVWMGGSRRASRRSCGLRHTLQVTLLFLAPAFLLVLGATLINASFLSFLPLQPDRYVADARHTAQLPFWVALVTWVMVPAVFEELAFRGVIQPGLARAHGPAVGVVGGALLFSLIHLYPYQMVGVFLPGLAFGYLSHVSRSVVPAMVAHGFLNLFALLATRMRMGNEASPPPEVGAPLLSLLWGVGCVALAVAMCRHLSRKLFPVPTSIPPGDGPPADPPRPESDGG